MNKIVSVFILIYFSLTFIGCSSEADKNLIEKKENLYKVSMNKDIETLWTRELESVRLLTDINKSENVNPSIKLSPLTVNTAINSMPVLFPFISGFGSLDVSEMQQDLLDFIQTVCDNFNKFNLSQIPAENSGTISLVMFRHDIKSSWNSRFGGEFPQLNDEIQQSDNAEKLFSSYLIGKPFINSQSFIVPVRFYRQEKFIDMHLYISKSPEFKLLQMQLLN